MQRHLCRTRLINQRGGDAAPFKEAQKMYAPVKEIMTDLLKYNLSSDEALLVLCITREDIRMQTTEWNLSGEDITCVMQRLDATYD